MMELQKAKEGDKEIWDDIVQNSASSTLFHRWDFLKAAEKYSKTKFHPLMGYNGDEPVAAYPLFLSKKLFLRMVFSPPPHSAIFYLGPAMRDDSTVKNKRKTNMLSEFQEKADEYAIKELKADYVSVHSVPGLDCRPFRWTGYRLDAIYNYCIDLKDGPEKMWMELNSDIRRNIKNAVDAGVVVEPGGKEELSIIYDLMNRRYEDQGKLITVPKEYLLEVYDAFPENFRILVAKHEGEIKSGLINIFHQNREIGWIGNPKTDMHKVHPNILLLWESLKRTHQSGIMKYEIVGAAGVKRFANYYEGYNPGLMLNFSAIKYNSSTARTMEQIYLKTLKPAYAKLKIGRKGQKDGNQQV